jgi:hypothetical protein
MIVALDGTQEVAVVAKWIREWKIRVLNVAGPRESSCPGVEADARHFVEALIYYDRQHTPAGS